MREIDATPEAPESAPGKFKAMIPLVWAIWAFDFIGILFLVFEDGGPQGFFFGAMLMLGLRVWVQRSLGDRKKWARVVMTILSLIGVLSIISGGLRDVFSIIALTAVGVLLYLLGSSEIKAWCVK
jgi:hypothetical protein